MLSSTSSSNQRLPIVRWLRLWLVAAAVVCVTLGAVESFWRAHGHVPTVNDDAALWMLARSAVRPNDPSEIVLLGASRMQQGLDLDMFARTFGSRKPVQLAVEAATLMPVLDDLSRDESFRGIAICDVMPFLFYRGGFEVDSPPGPDGRPQLATTPADYIRRYRSMAGFHGAFSTPLLERRLRTLVQERLVLRQPGLIPTASNVEKWITRRAWPTPSGRVLKADRSEKADYRSLDPEILETTKRWWIQRNGLLSGGAQPDELARGLARVETMVRRIQARGGRVVFVSFPVSGVVASMEEGDVPRHKYWDALASQTTALTIHWQDYRELSSFECLEGSHLDYRDAALFTQALARIVRERLSET